jgi:hypothetical protein
MRMEIQASDPVARFHRALVEEILRSRPNYLSEPFTVAEIYQNLVPYRTHRDRIGVEMNGDYEDALLRLLAGEGDYLVLESEHAVREIREELASSNPNTGLYRAYAAADVRLNPLRMPRDLPDPVRGPVVGQSAPPPPAPEPVVFLDALIAEVDPRPPAPAVVPEAAKPAAPSEPVKPAAPAPKAPAASAPPADPPPAPAAPKSSTPKAGAAAAKAAPATPAKPAPSNGAKSSAAQSSKAAARPAQPEAPAERAGPPSACHWCSEPLPRREVLNYCPFCGGNVNTAPCSNCGEELEVLWKFCVACGTAVGDRG